MSINQAIKDKAVKLRKSGRSYSEILKEVHVAKSTLALWLREVGLSQRQKQRITQKRLEAVQRGGLARRNQRLLSTRLIEDKAKREIGTISKRELFLIGVALYWAEGSKQKVHNVSQQVIFSNSDLEMLRFYLRWLKLIKVNDRDIQLSLYVHSTATVRLATIKEYWSKSLKLSINRFEKVYFKKGDSASFRKNKGEAYFGQVRIKVMRSTDLNRRINGWVKGICKTEFWGIV